jgi:hypothetical protein
MQWLTATFPSELRNLEEIPSAQLNLIFKSFYLRVRRGNGDEYEPESLDRYLCEKLYGYSMCNGDEIKCSREVLNAKGDYIVHFTVQYGIYLDLFLLCFSFKYILAKTFVKYKLLFTQANNGLFHYDFCLFIFHIIGNYFKMSLWYLLCCT